MAVHILNTVDIPRGVASEDYTNWIAAKNLTHKALYYRTYNDLTVRVMYLDKVQPQGKRLKLSLSTPVEGFKDTTDELKLLTVFFELQLTVWVPKVKPSYEALGTPVLDPSDPRLIYSNFNALRRTTPLVPLMTSSNCLGTVGAKIRDSGSSGCEGD